MRGIHQTETLRIKACCVCGAGLLERDKFCRWCGIPQLESAIASSDQSSDGIVAGNAHGDSFVTLRHFQSRSGRQAEKLRSDRAHHPSLYHLVSEPLVNAVVAGVSADASVRLQSRLARGIVLTLISIPVWLIVVLLSPLDAYGAAKAISNQA